MLSEVQGILTGKVAEQVNGGSKAGMSNSELLALISVLPPFQLRVGDLCLPQEKAEVERGDVICPGSQSQQVAHPRSELMLI